MQENNSITQVHLNPGEKLIKQSDKQITKPHFNMIGTGRIFMNSKRLPAVDLLKEMANMTAGESFTFLHLRDSIIYDHKEKEYELYIPIKQTEFTTYQKKLFKLGAKSLIERDLIRRVKRGTYMINPMAVIAKNFTAAEIEWNQLIKDSK